MLSFGLSGIVPYLVYGAGICAFFLSIFWKPIIGVYYLVPLIPLQTLRYKLIAFPLGQSVVDIILLGVLVGLLIRGRTIFLATPWNKMLSVYCPYTFISLCLGAFYLHRPLPLWITDPRLADWKNYIVMPLLLFVVAASIEDKRQMKVILWLMFGATLALNRDFLDTVGGRDYSSFSYDLRDAGGMGYAGVNGLAAFEAQACALLLALAAFEKRWSSRFAYWSLIGFSALCLMFSLSRGGYLAFLAGCLFVGLVKQRKLLILLAIFLATWASIVPPAVQQRVFMTYDKNTHELDHSSETRVNLWEEAMQIYDTNPLVGAGFFTYAYTSHYNGYKDTHNLYVKVLVETGVVGILLFLWLLLKTFTSGYSLFRQGTDPFLCSIGLGLSAWVVCVFVANLFGDRWTYLQVNGFMWVLAGLVSRSLLFEEEATRSKQEQPVAADIAGVSTASPEPSPVVVG